MAPPRLRLYMKKYILPLIVLGALLAIGSQAQAGMSITFVSGGGYQNCYQPVRYYNSCEQPVYYNRSYGRPYRGYYNAPQPVYYQPRVIYYQNQRRSQRAYYADDCNGW